MAVESTSEKAFHFISGGSTGVNEVVWVVQASGHFKCGPDCFGGPNSGSVPTHSILTLDIDIKTLNVTGLDLTNKWVDLSQLGPVVVLQS